jgi:ABC-type multidrug transport system ATPase subunit
MLVRLAFSVMIQAEADILLIDEVLAVGDASFRQKCRDVFREMRDSDRTVVLVTHDMSAVQNFCHRAMLLDDGDRREIGDPEEIGRQYLRMNFAKRRISIEGDREVSLVPDILARVSEAWLENERGERIDNIEVGEPIRIRAAVEARRDLDRPSFALHFNNADGVQVFALKRDLDEESGPEVLASGNQAQISASIENPLMPGRYTVVCWVAVTRNDEETAHQTLRLLDFVVFGVEGGPGIVSVEGELGVEVEKTPAPEAGP